MDYLLWNQPSHLAVRCALLGDDECNKTELLAQLKEITITKSSIERPPSDTHISPTVVCSSSKDFLNTVDKVVINLGLWDSPKAGLDKPKQLPAVFVILFAIDSPLSLQNVVSKWYPEISQYRDAAKIFLVGTKALIRNDPDAVAALKKKGVTPVTTEEGEAVMQNIAAVRYLECSISPQMGLKQVLEEAVRSVVYNYESTSDSCVSQARKLSARSLSIHRLDNSKFLNSLSKLPTIDLSDNYIFTLPKLTAWTNVTNLNLSENKFTEFPFASLKDLVNLKVLDFSDNFLESLPDKIPASLPHLKKFHVRKNRLNSIPFDLHRIEDLDVTDNPLSEIHPSFRTDKEKLLKYLSIAEAEPLLPWNQVKLMLVGQEGVGKTTLLARLQGNKFDQNVNLSTNGVQIGQVEISEHSKKNSGVQFNVWDFGGQAVFHSTHRFFMTSSAVYVIMYDISNTKTYERITYWIQQINAIVDEHVKSKPILILGTHADQLQKKELAQRVSEMDKLYPKSANGIAHPYQIVGHLVVSLSSTKSIQEIKQVLLDLVTSHPKIGIGKVKVPKSMLIVQDLIIKDNRLDKPYMMWHEYVATCAAAGITGKEKDKEKEMTEKEKMEREKVIEDITRLLHSIGTVTWYDTPRMRDLVVINPQWLANALASVVTFLYASSVAKKGGMITWHALKSSLKLRFPNESVHATILFMLELYEIILQIRTNANTDTQVAGGVAVREDQLYFVPSLLSEFDESTDSTHPAISFWQSSDYRSEFIRRFEWASYPSGLFPRILLRLFHSQLIVMACWLDCAVVMSRMGNDCALMRIMKGTNDTYFMEVSVRSSGAVEEGEELPLLSELVYVAVQMQCEMFPEKELIHEVVLPNKKTIPFTTCINAALQGGSGGMIFDGQENIPISQIAPDLVGYKEVDSSNLFLTTKLGEGGFGVVYKGTLLVGDQAKTIAAKELLGSKDSGTVEPEKLYEFQHEMIIMSKLQHENLVELLGITKQPLRLVLEFVPHGDLYHLLLKKDKAHLLTFTWRLKMAIDIADGARYLQNQTPPICHSDLRAPNIFVQSLDEMSDCVGKVADFGAAQQASFATKMLCNFAETAPETWGESAIKTAFYTEKSDVFSYAVILWRLFGTFDPFSTPGPIIGEERNGKGGEGKGEDGKGHGKGEEGKGEEGKGEEVKGKGEEGKGKGEGEEEKGESKTVFEDPYYHLQKPGKHLSDWSLRDHILSGERPIIMPACPQVLRNLMTRCWEIQPANRPSFDESMRILVKFYIEIYGEDAYIKKKIANLLPKSHDTTSALPKDLKSLSRAKWTEFSFADVAPGCRITSLLVVNGNIWAFSSNSVIIVLSPDGTRKKTISLPAPPSTMSSSSAKLVATCVGELFVWVANAQAIYVLHAKTMKVLSMLDNENYVTAMVYLNDKTIWVADANGFLSIWHMSLQKCFKLRVHNTQCVLCMTSMHSNVWMGVGKDVSVLDSQTLAGFAFPKAHGDRIQDIVAIPGKQQVWTCARDSSLCIWTLEVVEGEREKKEEKKDEKKDEKKEEKKEEMLKQIAKMSKSAYRFLSLTQDGSRMCSRTDGGCSLIFWNTQDKHESVVVDLPEKHKEGDLQCVLDCGKTGFWCGLDKMVLLRLTL